MNAIAYFDNAATTFPKPEEVYVFMDKFYRECGVNVGRGQHSLASKANVLVADTRKMVLDLMHATNKKVIFTHTATEALNTILRGISLSDNDTVYISPFEHNAVTRVLEYLRTIYKIKVQILAFDKTEFAYDMDKIKIQFMKQTPNMVIISHASNVCGIVAPIDEICSASKIYGAVNVVDMCQTAGLIDANLNNESIDFAVFAGHKTLYGPLGIAGFICSEQVKLTPLIFGGTGVDSQSQSMPETIPERYEAASPNIHAISGLHASLKWLMSTSIDNIYEVEKQNHDELLKVLSDYNNIRILASNTTTNNIGVVSCLFDGYSSDEIGRILNKNNIAVRTGLHCAPLAHQLLGTFPSGTVRFSISYFTSKTDFYMLSNALKVIEDNS